ncbi:MAG: Putative periplasmic protein [uncultured Sulfurovum sp.]|uniref:Periplasmic protein n=1 Tax=uncultured Sulfurovum sp. TaxID=269237 RepID=A0A6S6S8T8_9BACT|nr:MAG: Putative periplasmic protein [uncultured Sulfurovum sp.]
MVLYQKIYFREVIFPLKPLILISLFLLSLNASNNENNHSTSEENLTVQTQESFLSSVEYGRMLYQNPRGISCAQCHGKEGKGGQKIAKYYDKNKNPKLLKGVNITSYSLEDLKASLKNQYRENNRHKPHKIMPIYYLTNEEIQAIFDYLQYSNQEDD